MLRAALLEREPALEAWNEWKRNVNIDVIDYGSHRMVPKLYRNLQRHGVKEQLMDRFKGVYRYYLYKNEILMHRIGTLLAAFEEAQIQTMVLKGAALIQLYYKESGLRPMLDADVLVHASQAEQAMELLTKLRWKPVRYERPQIRIPILHSTPFEDDGGRQLDLHWHLFWECFNANDDDDYWENAVPIKIGGVQTLALTATDQLLHTCWHGARWNEVPPIRWIADAMAIMSAEEIDWARLVKKAQRHRIIMPVKDSLDYLKKTFDAPVPEAVLKSLSAFHISKMERENYEVTLNPMAPPTTTKILRQLYYDYRWLSSSTSARSKSLAFARHLQAKWDIDRLWQVPLYVSMRMARRVLTTRPNTPKALVNSSPGLTTLDKH